MKKTDVNACICKNTDGFVIKQFCIVIHKGKRVVLALARAKMTVANGQVPVRIFR